MKKLIGTAIGFLLFNIGIAQINPVSWTFTAKKVADKKYEIHLSAHVEQPWHIYSETTPAGGPVPTTINFAKNPLITNEGDIKEAGTLVIKHEEVFGVDVKYFDGDVDFVQVITLKADVKTKVNGTVKFMSCNDQQCLAPKTLDFSIEV